MNKNWLRTTIESAVILALIFVATKLGCGCASFARWQTRQERIQFVRDVTYIRDQRTKICFAHHRLGGIAVVDSRHCAKKGK